MSVGASAFRFLSTCRWSSFTAASYWSMSRSGFFRADFSLSSACVSHGKTAVTSQWQYIEPYSTLSAETLPHV